MRRTLYLLLTYLFVSSYPVKAEEEKASAGYRFPINALLESSDAVLPNELNRRLLPSHYEVLFSDTAEPLEEGKESPVIAFLSPPENRPSVRGLATTGFDLYVITPEKKPLKGTLYLSTPEGVSVALPFTDKMGEARSSDDLKSARKRHYAWLSSFDLPGTAWFRYQVDTDGSGVSSQVRGNDSDFNRFYQWASGGRAAAENLAFDRNLAGVSLQEEEKRTIPIDDIQGVTLLPFDWSDLLQEDLPAPGGLTRWIPSDQYWLSIPTQNALQQLFSMGSSQGKAILALLPLPGTYHGVYERYEEQMSLTSFRHSMESQSILDTSFALTGGDPFFATGTDVALLIDSSNPELIGELLLSSLKKNKRQKEIFSMSIDDREVLYAESENRILSIFATRLSENIWAVSNSLPQLERIMETGAGTRPSINDLEETVYFRSQLYTETSDELFFLLLSDDAIRKWASPHNRIANARRLLAATELLEQTASQIDKLASQDNISLQDLRGSRPQNPIYNALNFLTPVTELEVSKVTPQEKSAYEQWRNGYERGWAQVFDPIAIRARLGDDTLQTDLAVLPIRIDSDYNEILSITGNASIQPEHRILPQGTMMVLSLAVDNQSAPFLQYDNLVSGFFPTLEPQRFAWINESVSIALRDSLFWDALALSQNKMFFLEDGYRLLPIALRIESNSSLRLAGFLTGIRAVIEQTTPGLVKWTTREYDGVKYNAVLPNSQDAFDDMAVYYLASSDALTVSLDDQWIEEQATTNKENQFHSLPILGKHVQFEWTSKAVERLSPTLSDSYHQRKISADWAWLPILSEWLRLFPHLDPVHVHQALWAESVPDDFSVNQKTGLISAKASGSPAQPPTEHPKAISWLEDLGAGAMGLTFENDGLFASALLTSRKGKSMPETEKDLPAPLETARYYPIQEDHSLRYKTDFGYPDEEPIVVIVAINNLQEKESGDLSFDLVNREISDGEEYLWSESLLRQNGDVVVVSTNFEDERDFFSTPIARMPAKMTPGQRQTDSVQILDEAGDVIGIYVQENILIGLETVTVPAGTFEDCLRIDFSYIESMNGTTFSGRGSEWYAKDVGLVKSTWKDGPYNGYKILLGQFSD